jgi:HK97 family phage portal protein
MPIVQSYGALQAMTGRPPMWGSDSGSVSLYGLNQVYAEIYKTQPNVRICVDFLSRNIAQLAAHVFRRVSDTDRQRLVDHDLARWLGKPNPTTRRYRLMENLIGDLGIYFEAYWLKVRPPAVDGRAQLGLVRLPPEQMRVNGGLLPSSFTWTVDGREKDFALSEICYFNGYNPCNPLRGLSPLETLRRILAEEAAAGEHREGFWRNAARIDGVVTRPKEVKRYSPEQTQSWREQWQAIHAGGLGAGRTALLQDGETFTPTAFSARDSEYTLGGKLRREVCAAAYHIPQPMVGILEHATFSNIKEQHKHLYQDTLGPWLEMIQQEIEGQLLIECADQTDVYVEFNIADKLKGSFEEQATALQVLVGRPVMTANEGRARLNLPSIKDDPSADELAAQQGGPAASAEEPEPDEPQPVRRDRAVAQVIEATRARQEARLAKVNPAMRPAAFDLDRWNRELAADLTHLVGATAAEQLAAEANAAFLKDLEAAAVDARLAALEQPKPQTAVRRTFERDPANGLVQSFTDTTIPTEG